MSWEVLIMQSKTSFFNVTIFRKNLTHYWPMWTLYGVLLLCLYPVRILLNTGSSYSGITAEEMAEIREYTYINTLFNQGSGIWLAAISLAAGLVAAMCVFFYLYQHKSVQMFHSLPVRRGELFWTNYLSGLCMLWIPVMLSFLVGLVVCILQGITALEYLFAWFLIMVVENMFFYSMAVLVGMFTGHILGMLIFTLILNVLFIGCRYLVTSLLGMIGYGLSQSYANRQNSLLSPVVFLGNKVGVTMEEWGVHELYGLRYIGIYCVVAVLFAAAAYVLYRRRRLEATGDVLCVRRLRPVFRWGLAACAAFLMAMLMGNLFGYMIKSPRGMFALVLATVIVVGALAFFAAEMLLKKRLSVFTGAKWKECGVFVACAAAFIVAIECNAFGLETKIPDPEDVVRADISLYYDIEETDEEGIREIMDIHRKILADKAEYEQYQSGQMPDWEMMSVEIDYELKNGDVIVRTYLVPASASYYASDDSVVSEIYAMSIEPENYLRGMLCQNYEDVQIVSADIDFYDDELNYSSRKLSETEVRQIYSAYLKDIREGHIVIYAMDGIEDQLYMNQLNLQLYCRDGIQLSRQNRLRMEDVGRDHYVCLDLNVKCVHTIEALERTGILDGENLLILQSDYWKPLEEMNSQDEEEL